MAEILIDGVRVDDETGEILGDVTGSDRAAYAARQLADCKAQIKAYEQAAAIWQQALFKYQGDKTATYGDLRASIRQSRRTEQDVAGMREFIAGVEWTRDELKGFAIAAKGFDLGLLDENSVEALSRFQRETMTRPFVVIETVRKPAPRLERAS